MDKQLNKSEFLKYLKAFLKPTKDERSGHEYSFDVNLIGVELGDVDSYEAESVIMRLVERIEEGKFDLEGNDDSKIG